MKILFLCHSVPFPPDKGDRIRAFHLIAELSKEHTIFLHALSPESASAETIASLKQYCETVEVHVRHKILYSFLAALLLLTRLPITFGFFFSWSAWRGIRRTIRTKEIDVVFGYSSGVAPYLLACRGKKVFDLVDVDSAKWGEYAEISSFPKKIVYALECRRLSRWEAKIIRDCEMTFVCSEAEKEKLAAICPVAEQKVAVVKNGIEWSRFPRQHTPVREPVLAFTGQMDYLPNIDAVLYFYLEVLPTILRQIPETRFFIIGRNPDPIIGQTCREAVITGAVPDVGEYLRRTAVFVAPLRLAYGIQNKVLEAMATGIPVVATPEVQRGLRAEPGRDLLIGESPEQFAENVIQLLKNPGMGAAIAKDAFRFVEANHDWTKNVQQVSAALRGIDDKPGKEQ